MIAAIYARKSTEQTGTAEEATSVTRQIDHARAYAAAKGWTVAEAHVYVDDGISGAEVAKRPGLVRARCHFVAIAMGARGLSRALKGTRTVLGS